MELAQKTVIDGIDGDISTRTYYWLDIYYRNGSYSEWWVHNVFGNVEVIIKSIIAAYSYYRHSYGWNP